MKILYLLGTLPIEGETFILNEIMGLMELGHDIEIICLWKIKQEKLHDEINRCSLFKKTYFLEKKRTAQKIENLFSSNVLTKEKKLKLLASCLKCKEWVVGKKVIRKFLDCIEIIKFVNLFLTNKHSGKQKWKIKKFPFLLCI